MRRWKRARGTRHLMLYHFPLFLYLGWVAGWPQLCVFVTISKAQRYLATSITEVHDFSKLVLFCSEIKKRLACSVCFRKC
jgi:hypothetical protein